MNTSTIAKDAEKKVNGAASSMSSAADTVTDRLEKFSHDAGKSVGSFASQVSDSASDYVETSRSYIKENPIQSAAIAAAAGLAIGCLLTLAAKRNQ